MIFEGRFCNLEGAFLYILMVISINLEGRFYGVCNSLFIILVRNPEFWSETRNLVRNPEFVPKPGIFAETRNWLESPKTS